MAVLLSLLAVRPAFYGMWDFWFMIGPIFRVKGKGIKSQEESQEEKTQEKQ